MYQHIHVFLISKDNYDSSILRVGKGNVENVTLAPGLPYCLHVSASMIMVIYDMI